MNTLMSVRRWRNGGSNSLAMGFFSAYADVLDLNLITCAGVINGDKHRRLQLERWRDQQYS
jgi:hypothetical protein